LIEGVAEQCLGNGLDEMLIGHHQATLVYVVVLVVLVVVLVVFDFASQKREWGICSVWFIPDVEEEYFCFILDTKEVHLVKTFVNFFLRVGKFKSMWNILSEYAK
jgi:hypothetical protein